jgi:hypothetical protein
MRRTRPRLLAAAALLVAACAGCGGTSPPREPTPPPVVALPRVGTVGELPVAAPAAGDADEGTAHVSKALFLTVEASGDVHLQTWKAGDAARSDARKVAAGDLAKTVAAEAWTDVRDRTPDENASACHAVLRVDESVPWRGVAWILGALAESRVYRVAFAVRPEEAGEEGVFALYLPRDRGRVRSEGPAPVGIPVGLDLVTDRTPTYCAHVQAHLEELVARERNTGNHPIIAELSPTSFVPLGDVLHVADAALRAGCRGITVVGDTQAGKSSDPVVDAVRLSRRVAGRRLRVAVQGETVPVPKPGTETSCPKVPRTTGRLAGSYDEAMLLRYVLGGTEGGR